MTAREQPVEIVEYDPGWPARFEEERRALADVLAPWLVGPIEHIGSTAVPGLAAKPEIDIMAAVATLDESRDAIDAVGRLGYCYFPYRPTFEHWFCKPSPHARTHHLHLVPMNAAQWSETLVFRDRLRAEPAIAAEYEALKRRLAREYRDDREAYTEAKRGFVDRIIRP